MEWKIIICELGGKTPKEVAMPNLNKLRKMGVEGVMSTVPKGITPGSDVANLSVLGYSPEKFYTGRGAFEAAGRGIKLKEGEIAFRCNFITEKNGKIVDYSAGHLTNEEDKELVECIKPMLNEKINIYPGVGFRNILTMDGFSKEVECNPPHDFIDVMINKLLPKPKNENGRKTAEKLNELIIKSKDLLKNHYINKNREKIGKNTANMVWPWSPGIAPKMNSFKKLWGIEGAVITAVDVIKGIAMYSNMSIIDVPGATGYFDTNYDNKAEYALKALEKYDFVFVHIEAPDEAGHDGKLDEKIKALKNIDEKIIGRLIKEDVRIAVMADHFTPVKIRTHVAEPVPFVVYDVNGKKLEKRETMMKTLLQ